MMLDIDRVSRRDFFRVGLSLAAAPSLFACADSTTPATPPRLVARPGTPTDTPQLGLATPLDLGGSRDGFYYVPNTYTPAVAMPQLTVLHGAGGSASNWQSYVNRAETWGFVLLAIDSRGSTWDVVRQDYGPDPAFLDAALTYVFARCNIDASRVGLGGFSDGASYALSLGIPNGDLFRQVISYSPGFYDRGAPPAGSPTVFVSHGNVDPVLSFAHSRDSIVPSLEADGLEVTFRSFPGGHTVPADVTEEALDWFTGTPR